MTTVPGYRLLDRNVRRRFPKGEEEKSAFFVSSYAPESAPREKIPKSGSVERFEWELRALFSAHVPVATSAFLLDDLRRTVHVGFYDRTPAGRKPRVRARINLCDHLAFPTVPRVRNVKVMFGRVALYARKGGFSVKNLTDMPVNFVRGMNARFLKKGEEVPFDSSCTLYIPHGMPGEKNQEPSTLLFGHVKGDVGYHVLTLGRVKDHIEGQITRILDEKYSADVESQMLEKKYRDSGPEDYDEELLELALTSRRLGLEHVAKQAYWALPEAKKTAPRPS